MKLLGLEVRRTPSQPMLPGMGSPKAAQTGKGFGMRSMEFVRSIGLALRDGMSFQGNRDVYKVYGYPSVISYNDCRAKYIRQDIARRIVEMPADALWTDPPVFTGDDKVITVINDLVARLNFWDIINRADYICAMDDYAAILVGIDDNQGLDKPVNKDRANKITFMQPYAASHLKVQEYEGNINNPRFGKPLYYSLQADATTTKGPGITSSLDSIFAQQNQVVSKIHYSRVIHIADGTLEDEIFGSPRLRNVFNLLSDILKVGGGSAEVYWLNSRGGLHINVDKEMDLQSGDADDLADEVDDYANNLRRVIRTRGVDVNAINFTSMDPTKPFSVTTALLSGASGIPNRILFGSEAGQLASEQDRANWAVTVKQRRKKFAHAKVFRAVFTLLDGLGLIDLAKAQQILTIQSDGSSGVAWPEAFQLSPLERSMASAQAARSAANLQKCIAPKTPAGVTTVIDKETGVATDVQVPEVDDYVLTKDEARAIIMAGISPNNAADVASDNVN